MKVYDIYSPYHGKIDMSKVSPGYEPIIPIEKKKVGGGRLSRSHVRKQNFQVYDLLKRRMTTRKQPLPESFKAILELSTRAPFCPLPFNLDLGIGVCPFNCIYCFTSLTISSLVTAFFDSPNPFKPRFAKPEYVKKTMTEILTARGVEPYERDERASKQGGLCGSLSDTPALKKTAAQRIPVRIGNRFENFLPIEKRIGIGKLALEILLDLEYPTIINTKSTLVAEEPYVSLIGEFGDNIAIQMSIIHTDDKFAKKIEPGAPSPSERWEAVRILNEIGINAMPRMEPCAYGLNADDEHLIEYISRAKDAGCKHFMGDAWHHTVKAEEIRLMFYNAGIDFDRMWYGSSEYQIVGSYNMEKAMYYAKQRGIKCGTFNYHSIPYNDFTVCCCVPNLLKKGNFNHYAMVPCLKDEIIGKKRPLSLSEFDNKYFGREIHPSVLNTFRRIWNMEIETWGSMDWCEGVIPYGRDENGDILWGWQPKLIGEGYKQLISMFPNGGKQK